jgi:hypothetical protein
VFLLLGWQCANLFLLVTGVYLVVPSDAPLRNLGHPV